jgi:hypothetical protein
MAVTVVLYKSALGGSLERAFRTGIYRMTRGEQEMMEGCGAGGDLITGTRSGGTIRILLQRFRKVLSRVVF